MMEKDGALDAAIDKARRRAQRHLYSNPVDAAEQRQLADWLQELRSLRMQVQPKEDNPNHIGYAYTAVPHGRVW